MVVFGSGEGMQQILESLFDTAVGREGVESQGFRHLRLGLATSAGVRHCQSSGDAERRENDVASLTLQLVVEVTCNHRQSYLICYIKQTGGSHIAAYRFHLCLGVACALM